MKQISIVIPTLNEQDSIARTVSSVLGPVAIEVIVADGSSTDSTAEKALIAGAQVVVSDRGRGLQMNAGSQIASGEVLLFLHADTLLPKNYNLYIDGQMVPAAGDKYFQSINPSNEEVFAEVADASLEDMQSAISAAREAFDNGSWSELTVKDRGAYLEQIANLIRDNAKELADLEKLPML